MYISSLSVSVNSTTLINTMALIMVGIFLATLYTIFVKKFRGEFVMALIDACAFSEDSAKSMEELGIKTSFWRKLVLDIKFSFSPDYITVEKNDRRYYIDEDNVEKLSAKYRNSSITLVQLIITIIAFFAVALIMATAVPEILNMFNL